MSKLTCTEEMYQAFMASMGHANFQNEAIKDWIKNGVEAALAAMPTNPITRPTAPHMSSLEIDGWNACWEALDDLGPLFTHPDANTVNREVERQLRLFAQAIKSLCKDFSDLQNRPYMGDVTSAVDGLLEQHVECLEIDEASRPSPMEAHTIAHMALGIPWRDVESQARRVAEQAAERINLMNGVGQPKPEQPLLYEARLRGEQEWVQVHEAVAKSYQRNLARYEVRVIKPDGLKGKGGHVCSCETPCPPPAMPRSRYMQLQNGKGQLTAEERAAGWFFDDEYDGLLANRRWPGHEGL